MSSSTNHTTAFGRLLRFWRVAFGKSQEELAHEIDSSPRHVSRLENGRVLPSEEMVERIVSALGLGGRDTAHLLFAAGHSPPPAPLDVGAQELRWLRRTSAMLLQALDPFPSMLTDGVAEIHLVNRSWLGLLGDDIDPAAPDGVQRYFGFLLDAIRSEVDPGVDSQCGLLLTLRQEALIRDDPRLHQLVDDLARDHGVPSDWVTRAAQFEPVASFGVWVDLGGSPHRFFHLSRTMHPHGPSTYLTGGGLAMLSLLPADHARDWSFLAEHDHDHPRLAAHELRSRS